MQNLIKPTKPFLWTEETGSIIRQFFTLKTSKLVQNGQLSSKTFTAEIALVPVNKWKGARLYKNW